METEETAVAEVNTGVSTFTSADGMAFDSEDIDIPRINIIQKMSNIEGPNGAVIINKTHIIAEAETPVDVIVVTAQKGWREDIPFDNDQTPRIAMTKEAMERMSLDSDFGFTEFAEITLLIEQPEGNTEDDAFPFAIADKNYALGRINVSKNAYRSTFKRLATFAALNRSIPLHSRVWTFVSEVLEKGKYTWHSPSLTISKKEVPAAVTQFLNSFTA